MDENSEYRKSLVVSEQESQNSYDKSIISLSGSALALSIVFIKDIIGEKEPINTLLLQLSWTFWALSILCIVFSFYFSKISFRKAIKQTDQDDFSGGVGGWASIVTNYLNLFSGIFFIVGVFLIISFASYNL